MAASSSDWRSNSETELRIGVYDHNAARTQAVRRRSRDGLAAIITTREAEVRHNVFNILRRAETRQRERQVIRYTPPCRPRAHSTRVQRNCTLPYQSTGRWTAPGACQRSPSPYIGLKRAPTSSNGRRLRHLAIRRCGALVKVIAAIQKGNTVIVNPAIRDDQRAHV